MWEILIYIDIEKDVVIRDIIEIIKIDELFQDSMADINIISLIVLIEGGAEMLIAMKINHQNEMFGKRFIIPLNIMIFREWYFKYKSFDNINRALALKPWAIIIIIAPYILIVFMEKILAKINLIWAIDE